MIVVIHFLIIIIIVIIVEVWLCAQQGERQANNMEEPAQEGRGSAISFHVL